MLTIGNLVINEDYPVLLAPMEDVTDPSFRYLCKKFGVDLMYTEFVASEALIRNIDKTIRKMTLFDAERPVGIQLYGHNIDAMVESAKFVTQYKPDLIDLNFGCPVKKIATRGAGSGMMRDPDKLIKMTAEVVKATNLPVTVKTRLGWDDNSKNIVEIAERLQDTGIKALTIHGRTRAQMYKGTADWTLIGEIKNNPRIHTPIIGNGDIDSPQKAKEMFDRYGVDAIMIGRATYGRPWIFREVKHFLNTGELLPPMALKEKVETAKLQLIKSIEWKGEKRGVYEMRRHFTTYFKGLPNFKPLRMQLVTTDDPQDLIALLDSIYEKYQDFEFNETDYENPIAK